MEATGNASGPCFTRSKHTQTFTAYDMRMGVPQPFGNTVHLADASVTSCYGLFVTGCRASQAGSGVEFSNQPQELCN